MRSSSTPDPAQFARRWIDAWNARDLDAVLALFSEDAVFTSPYAAKVLPGTEGRVQGKPAMRAYWSIGLANNPDLHFTLQEVFEGIDTLVILYRNHAGRLVSEVLRFRDGIVIEGSGNYAIAS